MPQKKCINFVVVSDSDLCITILVDKKNSCVILNIDNDTKINIYYKTYHNQKKKKEDANGRKKAWTFIEAINR